MSLSPPIPPISTPFDAAFARTVSSRLKRGRAKGRRPMRAARARLGAAALLSVLGAVGAAGTAQAQSVETGSKVSAVTVYPRGATISREAAFAAPQGRNSIVIADLPIDIDADSLRVEGAVRGAGGGFSILGLNYRVDRPGPRPLSNPDRERLEEEIRNVEFDIRGQDDAIVQARARRAYAEGIRKATLQARPTGKGEAGAASRLVDDVARWREAFDLVAEEIGRAQRAEREAERRKFTLNKALERLRRQLGQTAPRPPRGVLTVSVRSDQPIEDGVLAIRYLTRNASWSPLYDLRLQSRAAKDGGKAPQKSTLTVVRRAAVRQWTGEDWRGVALTLSTAQPTARLEAQDPRLAQARLRPPPPPKPERARAAEAPAVADQAFKRGRTESAGAGAYGGLRRDQPLAAAQPRPASEVSALASYQGAAAIYQIPDPVDAPGDGETRQARIGAFETLVETEARTTPALDPTAYLYAIFPNGDAPLPPGRASIYRGEAYLGQLRMPYVAPGETKPLAFGRYEALKVERRIRDRSEGQEGVFTTSNRRQSRFEIKISNLGGEAVTVRVADSLPYTEDERIKIALNSAPKPDARDMDGRRGALEWRFPLAPKGSKSISFSYTLSWPEGEKLDLLRRR